MRERDYMMDRLLGRVLRYGSLVGLVLAFVGSVLLALQPGAAFAPGTLSAYPFSRLLGALQRGDPLAILETGLLILLLTPPAAILVAAGSYVREKRWRHVLAAVIVLLILALGMSGLKL